MPAKKTFHSIWVRGPARFDVRPTHAAVPLPVFREYVAAVAQVGAGAPSSEIRVNTLGGVPVWSRVSAGHYLLTLAGAFPRVKTFVNWSHPVFDVDSSQCTLVAADVGIGDYVTLISEVCFYDAAPGAQQDDLLPQSFTDVWTPKFLTVRVYL